MPADPTSHPPAGGAPTGIPVWFVERFASKAETPEWLRHGQLARGGLLGTRDDAWTTDPREALICETEAEAHLVISRYVDGMYARPTEHVFMDMPRAAAAASSPVSREPSNAELVEIARYEAVHGSAIGCAGLVKNLANRLEAASSSSPVSGEPEVREAIEHLRSVRKHNTFQGGVLIRREMCSGVETRALDSVLNTLEAHRRAASVSPPSAPSAPPADGEPYRNADAIADWVRDLAPSDPHRMRYVALIDEIARLRSRLAVPPTGARPEVATEVRLFADQYLYDDPAWSLPMLGGTNADNPMRAVWRGEHLDRRTREQRLVDCAREKVAEIVHEFRTGKLKGFDCAPTTIGLDKLCDAVVLATVRALFPSPADAPRERDTLPAADEMEIDDPVHYGVKFRWNPIAEQLEYRHDCPTPELSKGWTPLLYRHRGDIGCVLGWTPERLRIWADLMDRAAREGA